MPLAAFPRQLARLFAFDAAPGIALVAAAIIALVWANSPAASSYVALLETPVSVTIGAAGIHKPLLLWINDGLMALFFLLVGLEIKREVLGGHLSSIRDAALPIIGAAGGMVVPALVYLLINWGHGDRLQGWAIPTATDIAFALGVLALLGKRVPAPLVIFLLALAVMDDLGAIVIIALVYTGGLSTHALLWAGFFLALLVALNLMGVRRLAPYLLVGLCLWVSVLKSGVHATLAGVAIGLAIPYPRDERRHPSNPLLALEHFLKPWVDFAILPFFAFANAGVSLAGMGMDALTDTLPLGIEAGLFLGKQAGVMLACGLAMAAGLARLPPGVRWPQFYGVAVLTGIGFTMSLFIGTLAFPEAGYSAEVRVGVLSGSLLSALVGGGLLWAFTRPSATTARRPSRH